MPWGSGTFTRVYNWYQQYLDGFGIDPQKMDSEDDNFAGGINNCLTKDGQNAPSQDLPMGGKKHTNVGDAVGRNEYLAVGQYQDGWGIYAGDSTGDADNYDVSLSPVITSYVDGMRLWFKAHIDCNDGATLTLNTISALPLVVGAIAVTAGDILAGQIYAIIYNSSIGSWQIHASDANTFISQSDTPAAYAGFAGQAPVVNETEDGLTFGGSWHGVRLYSSDGVDKQSWAGGENEAVAFTGEFFDTDAYHNPTTNKSRITIPVNLAGIYRVSYMIRAVGGNSVTGFYVTKNGVNTAIHVWNYNNSEPNCRAIGTFLVQLEETDYIEVYVDAGGTTLNLSPLLGTQTQYKAEFSAEWVGPVL